MINFRKKKYLIQNLMPDAIEYLKKQGLRPNIITPEQADSVSRVNSKAMVLVSFIKNESGYYQIQVQDKELYNYTQKLIKDIFRMRITDINKETRVITAETDHLGIAFDIIEILATKYNLSVVA
jgi:hypothetical protein|nr:MAG: hypothetical protein [Bacteriophage sp.]DAG94970.1 MAG TPA: hypothetical protein [Crassvirales sp.]DAV74143.1 MAG TPA: hypothetical protein [Bacteriophage sp.]DAW87519.1 MAG TPA: hypothetical protein [Bacteriophage sp.]